VGEQLTIAIEQLREPASPMRETMTEAGLEDMRIASVSGMSWSAVGTRPLGPNEINRS